jgi:hypothetical protein
MEKVKADKRAVEEWLHAEYASGKPILSVKLKKWPQKKSTARPLLLGSASYHSRIQKKSTGAPGRGDRWIF